MLKGSRVEERWELAVRSYDHMHAEY
jgi:hypothetical protein